MRISILLAALLTLAGCGGGGAANNAAVADESDSTQITAANDLTAIDAATGEAANIAADVNYMVNEQALNGTDNGSASKKPARTREPTATTPVEPDEPAPTTASTTNSGATD